MREIRPSGSEGGARSIPCPYPSPTASFRLSGEFQKRFMKQWLLLRFADETR